MQTFDAEVNRYGEETMLNATFADGSVFQLSGTDGADFSRNQTSDHLTDSML